MFPFKQVWLLSLFTIKQDNNLAGKTRRIDKLRTGLMRVLFSHFRFSLYGEIAQFRYGLVCLDFRVLVIGIVAILLLAVNRQGSGSYVKYSFRPSVILDGSLTSSLA